MRNRCACSTAMAFSVIDSAAASGVKYSVVERQISMLLSTQQVHNVQPCSAVGRSLRSSRARYCQKPSAMSSGLADVVNDDLRYNTSLAAWKQWKMLHAPSGAHHQETK